MADLLKQYDMFGQKLIMKQNKDIPDLGAFSRQ